MELSEEAKVWIKQGENRIKSCNIAKEDAKRQISILKEGIKLEDKQISLIKKDIVGCQKSWKTAKMTPY